ncbi:MAG: hypothetical protein ABSD31_19615 [Candidatus Binataceae bacterium]
MSKKERDALALLAKAFSSFTFENLGQAGSAVSDLKKAGAISVKDAKTVIKALEIVAQLLSKVQRN